jgi:hypothetical protein
MERAPAHQISTLPPQPSTSRATDTSALSRASFLLRDPSHPSTSNFSETCQGEITLNITDCFRSQQ